MTQLLEKNARNLSGERVVAQCEFFTPTFNRLLTEKSNTSHPIVFNLRGGCIYIQEYIDANHLHALFPVSRKGKVAKLALFDDVNHFSLSNININFVRLKPSADAIGIVFRFANLSLLQMDSLQKAHQAFSAVDGTESAIQLSNDLLHWQHNQFNSAGLGGYYQKAG